MKIRKDDSGFDLSYQLFFLLIPFNDTFTALLIYHTLFIEFKIDFKNLSKKLYENSIMPNLD